MANVRKLENVLFDADIGTKKAADFVGRAAAAISASAGVPMIAIVLHPPRLTSKDALEAEEDYTVFTTPIQTAES